MFLLNNKKITICNPFEHNGTSYFADWFNELTAEQMAELGIQVVEDYARPDDRFYWVQENVDGSYSTTDKDLNDREEIDQDGNPLWVKVLGEVDGQPAMVDSNVRLVTKGLKTNFINQINLTMRRLLKPTDPKVTDNSITDEETAYRAAVIAEGTRITDAIANVTSVAELSELLSTTNWPKELEE